MSISTNLKGNYHEIIGKSKQLLGKISNQKVLEFNGDVEQMAGHIQKEYKLEYAIALDSAKRIIANTHTTTRLAS